MELIRRVERLPARLTVFPGAFNPPTRAHVALAEAALREADEVLFVLPRAFPHKEYEGASFADRLRLLDEVVAGCARFSLGVSEGGLFADIAREARAHYPRGVALNFLCGRDAAERIVNWNYGRDGAVGAMLEDFGLLVARREGEYEPPAHLRRHIRTLALDSGWDAVSATTVRRRIAARQEWRDLVPEPIAAMVEEIYGR